MLQVMFGRTILNRTRPCLGSLPQLMKTSQRGLSVNETAIALRPFFFAVHPDLFGLHPKERAVNEDSMKHLQQYIEGVRNQRRLPPAKLTFYIRDTENTENAHSKLSKDAIQEVSISLATNTVRDAVMTVLSSCNLSLQYVNTVASNTEAKIKGSDRPITWDPTFYTYYGIPNPFAVRKRNKVETSLSSWLQKNIPKAQKNLETVEPVRQQTTRMVAELKKMTGLSAIRWECDWSLAQFRACLLNLKRLCEHHSSEIDLTEKTLVFGNETGLCLRGAIILRYDQVPDQWLWVIKRAAVQTNLLKAIPGAEEKLSRLLNNVKIVHQSKHHFVLAEEYLHQVERLTGSMQRFREEQPESVLCGDFSDINVIIKCDTGSLSLSSEGYVLVPSSCPGFMIVDFLQSKVEMIRHARKLQQWSWREEEEFTDRVAEQLSLLSLVRDQNVTWQQMKECCQLLLSNQSYIGVSLDGLRLRISHFYSVMSDGEIYIPWDWKKSSEL